MIWSHIFLRVRVCTGLLTISMSGFNKLNWTVQVRLNSSMSVKLHWGKYVAKVPTFNCYGISPGTYNVLWDTGAFKIPENYWLFFCPWFKWDFTHWSNQSNNIEIHRAGVKWPGFKTNGLCMIEGAKCTLNMPRYGAMPLFMIDFLRNWKWEATFKGQNTQKID